MDPLTNIQIALKNNIDVFYFSTFVPVNVLFLEDGQMGKKCATIHPQYSRYTDGNLGWRVVRSKAPVRIHSLHSLHSYVK
jgi:hypothetical protein